MTWVVVLATAAGTYLLRASTVLAADRWPLPPWLERRLALLAPAVAAGLLVTTLVPAGTPAGWPSPGAVGSLAAAFLAVRRTRNLAFALVVGVPLAAVLP